MVCVWSRPEGEEEGVASEVMAHVRFAFMIPEVLAGEVEGHPLMRGEVRMAALHL